MPLFYFDAHDGSGTVLRDDEGVSFPDMRKACNQAQKTLCEMGRDLSDDGPHAARV
jgi:hypothetical protein